MREDGSAPAGRTRLAAVLPALVFGLLLAVSWNRWAVPFQDTGREVVTAARLLDGERLYRDVVWRYGPLSPHVDALALALLGRSLESLLAVRLLVAFLGVEALRRLALRLSGDGLLAALSTCLAVATCVFLPFGGAWPFPYSAAAVEGMVVLWWALLAALGAASPLASAGAGLLGGVAASTKIELVLPALLVPAGVVLLRRGRREAAAALAAAGGLAALAWGAPLAAWGAGTMARRGFLIAFDVPEPWRRAYLDVFRGGLDLTRPFSAGGLPAFGVSAVVLAVAVLALLRPPSRPPLRFLAPLLLFLLGLAGVLVSGNEELRLFVPLAAAASLAALWRAWRQRGRPDASLAAAAVALVLLPAVARQPFGIRPEVPYGAISGPLALVVALSALARMAGGPLPAAALAAGLCVAQVADRVRDYRLEPRRTARFERGTLTLLPAEAALLEELVRRIRADTPPRSFVAGFPEPGLVLFLADRRSPFPDDQFHPGAQDEEALDEMLELLDRRRPAAVFLLNRAHPEFGEGAFGLDYHRRFLAALERRYERAAVIGSGGAPSPRGLRASAALYYLPRRDVTSP